MASHDELPLPEFVTINKRPPVSSGHGVLPDNRNHHKRTLGLPPGSDVLSPTDLRTLFAEWRADYAAGKEGLEPPALSNCDLDGPER